MLRLFENSLVDNTWSAPVADSGGIRGELVRLARSGGAYIEQAERGGTDA